MAKKVKAKIRLKRRSNSKKKEKHSIGPVEFIFNFLSLTALIGMGVYFGYRSLYYYSKQNMILEEEAMTLNGLIINNNPVVHGSDEGLHQDSDGYYFKGKVENNYVIFANRAFRVIRVNNDNTVRLVAEDIAASFMWGESSDYFTSNVYNWLNTTDLPHSGVYYQTIPDPKEFITKTKYTIDLMEEGKTTSGDQEFKDYVSTLSVRDYVLANGKSSYLNTGKLFYLLGYDEDESNLYVEEDGSIQDCDSLDGFGIRPVITLKKNMVVSTGDGSFQNPYVIMQGEHKNYVDTYVQMGTDMWRVYRDDSGILRMYKNGYITYPSGEEVFLNYSNTNSIFRLEDDENIAYYLNHNYLGSLPYAGVLLDTYFTTGEISDDTGYSFENTYVFQVVSKVGLLSIFDYNASVGLTNYFHMNTTSEVGSMQYNRYANGLLEEADVREYKHIVPVVSISKDSITSGSGSFTDPYVVG